MSLWGMNLCVNSGIVSAGYGYWSFRPVRSQLETDLVISQVKKTYQHCKALCVTTPMWSEHYPVGKIPFEGYS
ncbi:hypothetical protein TNCV_310931 [Trichonephila clavipes]|nr:hypothetical protein TNCV_310931 [Trichonephila clavipes]